MLKSSRNISTEIVSICRMSNSSQAIVRAVILTVCTNIPQDNVHIRNLVEQLKEQAGPSGIASDCMQGRCSTLIEGFSAPLVKCGNDTLKWGHNCFHSHLLSYPIARPCKICAADSVVK
jgi:hypothetical protein